MASQFVLPENEFDMVMPPAARENYENVKDLHDAYQRSGYGKEDRIPHRLMVTLMDFVLEDLGRAKTEAEGRRQYKKAEEITKRVNVVRRQFREKQEWQLQDQQRIEMSQMDKAKDILADTFRNKWNNTKHEAIIENAHRKRITEEKHAREIRDLERKIRKIPPPVAAMSKELVGYVALEKHMRKNGQYQDATTLAKKIEKLAPIEQAAAVKKFRLQIDSMREKLKEKHEEERKQLFEHSKAALIKVRDDRAIASNVNKQAMKMHSNALNHALTLEMNEPAGWNRNIRPIVEKRAHYWETTSSKRGTQVLESVTNSRLYAPKLSETHEFENQDDCIIDYDTYATLKLTGGVLPGQ